MKEHKGLLSPIGRYARTRLAETIYTKNATGSGVQIGSPDDTELATELLKGMTSRAVLIQRK
jgi:hypothetical protein